MAMTVAWQAGAGQAVFGQADAGPAHLGQTRSWHAHSAPVGSWQADSLEVQQRRVGDAIATLEQLRRALVSTAAEMQWRSRTAGRFARRVEVQVASMDGLVLALRELEGALVRARSRMLHVEHVPG